MHGLGEIVGVDVALAYRVEIDDNHCGECGGEQGRACEHPLQVYHGHSEAEQDEYQRAQRVAAHQAQTRLAHGIGHVGIVGIGEESGLGELLKLGG